MRIYVFYAVILEDTDESIDFYQHCLSYASYCAKAVISFVHIL